MSRVKSSTAVVDQVIASRPSEKRQKRKAAIDGQEKNAYRDVEEENDDPFASGGYDSGQDEEWRLEHGIEDDDEETVEKPKTPTGRKRQQVRETPKVRKNVPPKKASSSQQRHSASKQVTFYEKFDWLISSCLVSMVLMRLILMAMCYFSFDFAATDKCRVRGNRNRSP
jgi:hypothetical protein